MTNTVEERLAKLGLSVPPAKAPVANYLGCKRVGEVLYVSARVSDLRGEVGSEVDFDAAVRAARDTALLLLGIVKAELGDLDRVASVDFVRQPAVVDGASDLLVALYGEEGRHARTATGAPQLPFGAAVQLEMILRLRA